jgi:membrane fusion protein, multidrug efflux system
MELDASTKSHKQLGRFISISIVIAAIIFGVIVLCTTNYYPRTDDAEVFANFIGMAPQVDGPLVRLCVRDNQFVKKSELLYEIERRPYQYAPERAVSQQLLSRGKSRMRREELRRW